MKIQDGDLVYVQSSSSLLQVGPLRDDDTDEIVPGWWELTTLDGEREATASTEALEVEVTNVYREVK